jgi:ATP/ADP translocase/HEAT repeat protein
MSSARVDAVLESAFRIRPGEGRQVGLMFLFLMGVVSTFIVGRTVRDTLFLHRVPLENLSLMYVAVALAVGTTAYFYSRVADKYRRDRLVLTTLTIASCVFTVIWAGIRFQLAGSWLYFLLYVVVDIIGQITIIQFWTLANDIFSGRQAKRLFGVIGAGGVLANVICGFTIGSIAPLIGSENLLLVIAGLFFSCTIAVRAIAVQSGGDLELAVQKPRKAGIGVRAETSAVLHSTHLKIIAGIVVLTFLTVTIIDYQFKVIAKSSLTGEGEMAAYFGYFYGFTGIIASIIQFLVTGRLLERSGVVVSLLVLPAAMLLGAGSLLAVPMIAGIVAATIAKGAENIFRYTINDATMQLLYVPVPANNRGRAKAFIDGILKPISIGVSGVMLYLLGRYLSPQAFALQLAYLDLALLGGWIFLVIGIRKEYVRSLIETLRSRKLDLDSGFSLIADEATLRVLRERLGSPEEADVLRAMEIIPSIDGADFFDELTKLLSHPSMQVRISALEIIGRSARLDRAPKLQEMMSDREPRVRAAAIRAFCAVGRERAIRAAAPYLTDSTFEVRGAAVAALIKHGGLDGILTAAETLKGFLASTDAAERLQGARVLAEIKVKNFFHPVLELLQDSDVRVRIAAIDAAGEMQSKELVPPLIYKLSDPTTVQAATRALIRFGPDLERTLLRVVGNDEEDPAIRRAIPKILAKVGAQASLDKLLETLGALDPQLRANAAKAAARIRERNPRIAVDDARLLDVLKGEIRGAYEALVAIEDLQLVPDHLLSEALFVRHKQRIGVAFRLLEIRHPARTIQLVYANLDSENKTVRANALEVVDNILDKEEADLLLPLLEDHSMAKKIAHGHELFAIERKSREEWIDLLLEDPNPWVVVCTLHLVGEHHLAALRTKVNRHLSSHDPVVRETACLALDRLGGNNQEPLPSPVGA